MPRLFQYQVLAEPIAGTGDSYRQLVEANQPYPARARRIQQWIVDPLQALSSVDWFDVSEGLVWARKWPYWAMVTTEGGMVPFVPPVPGVGGGDYLLLLGVQ